MCWGHPGAGCWGRRGARPEAGVPGRTSARADEARATSSGHVSPSAKIDRNAFGPVGERRPFRGLHPLRLVSGVLEPRVHPVGGQLVHAGLLQVLAHTMNALGWVPPILAHALCDVSE